MYSLRNWKCFINYSLQKASLKMFDKAPYKCLHNYALYEILMKWEAKYLVGDDERMEVPCTFYFAGRIKFIYNLNH